MRKIEDFGCCGACAASLTARYTSLNRLVERTDYDRPGETPDDQATITTLRDDVLGEYCDAVCAMPSALLVLFERGLRHAGGGAGPIETCAKCGGPVDLTEPHVTYQLMDQTETRKPWLISIQPHDAEVLAYVCQRCDGDLAADEFSVPETVVDMQPVGLPMAVSYSIEPE